MPCWPTSIEAEPFAAPLTDDIQPDDDPASRPLRVAALSLFLSLAILFLGLHALMAQQPQARAEAPLGRPGDQAWQALAQDLHLPPASALVLDAATLRTLSADQAFFAGQAWRRDDPQGLLVVTLVSADLGQPAVQGLIAGAAQGVEVQLLQPSPSLQAPRLSRHHAPMIASSRSGEAGG